MYLGISAFYHESSVALISKEGELLNFQKEEWHSRVKGDKSFPKLSIVKILEDSADKKKQITDVIFYERPMRAWLTVVKDSIKNYGYLNSLSKNYFRNFFNGSMSFYKEISKFKELKESNIKYFDHHLSHSYSALMYSKSSFPKISIVIDGIGDQKTISVFKIKSLSEIELIWSLDYPFSLGLFYSAITDFIGYSVNDGEYKVMALSSYGEPLFKEKFNQILGFDKGNFKFDTSYFAYQYSTEKSYSKKFEQFLGKPRQSIKKLDVQDNDFQFYADIASSAQVVLEEITLKLFKYIHKQSDIKNFMFSGGVSLNSKLVSKLSKLDFIDSLEIPSSPGDSGASIGAAYFLSQKKNIPKGNNLYAGIVNHNKNFIEQKFRKIYNKEDIIEGSVSLLNKQNIICTCIGNIETGPRALGNRSFLCDAKNEFLVKELNTKVKRRSSFIPTAPVMTKNIANEYFYLDNKSEVLAQNMSTLVEAKQNALKYFKSILHCDHTSRIQISMDETYVGKVLISKKADFHILANTSFNISSDPMVYSLEDAIMTIKRTGLKYLVTDFGIFEI